jgi:sugar/nucleoside kinase (ribokinase family)
VAAGSDTPSRVLVTGGGAAANTAAWLAAAGHPVTFVGRVGDDVFGRAALAELASTGATVRAAVDPERPTGTCVVLVTQDGSRSMFPDTGANAGLRADDLPPEAFAVGAHLHLSGYALLTEGSRPAALAALAAARSAGMTISVDPGSAGPIRRVGVQAMMSWISGADLLLANDDEACLLAGQPGDPAAAAARLAEDFGQVVVKLGAAGATWTRAGAPAERAPAVAAVVVDTTGAGDCFAAGFLPVWLGGSAPLDALRAGCALAAQVVARPGARPLPSPPHTS